MPVECLRWNMRLRVSRFKCLIEFRLGFIKLIECAARYFNIIKSLGKITKVDVLIVFILMYCSAWNIVNEV